MTDDRHDNPDALLDEAFRQMRATRADEQDMLNALVKTRIALHKAMQAGPSARFKSRRILRPALGKLAIAAAFVAAFIGLEAWLHVGNGRSGNAYGLAFAEVVEKLRSVQTMTFTITVPTVAVVQGDSRPGAPWDLKVMCAGTKRRIEYPHLVRIEDDNDERVLTLVPQGQSAFLMNRRKARPAGLAIGDVCGGLFKRWGSASESLGERVIDGRVAVGFRVTYTLDGNTGEDVVWVDPVTKWVIRIEHTSTASSGRPVVMHNFAFDMPLDESLFSLDPPPGYTVSTATSPAASSSQQTLTLPRKNTTNPR